MAVHFQRSFSSVSLVCLFMLLSSGALAQCVGGSPADAAIQDLYAQQKWQAVIDSAQRERVQSADVNFELGMALAHLQRWNEARAALIDGRRRCPKQKRFPIELAGVAFQQKRYPEAAAWIRKGLRLDPRDEYANEFAGTVYLLMDNLDAALKYWNRIHRPEIGALQIDSQLRVHRLLLERAIVFSPQALMRREDLLASRARLEAMEIFPAYSIRLAAQPGGKFDADFHATERNGFGNGWLQSLVAVFSGLPYETIYPSYFNVGGTATNFESVIRWDAQKRRLWLVATAPVHTFPQWRWQAAVDGRDENWTIRSSFTGASPAVGSFKLKREAAEATITSIHSGRTQWSMGGELSHRTYGDVAAGLALTPQLVSPGFELKHVAGVRAEWIDLPEHRFTMSVAASSELARMWSSPARLFEKAQGGVSLHWVPRADSDTYEFSQRARGGGIAGTAPIDELWMIGVERDTDLWLRGHIGTRDGQKGSSPVADRYFLSNSDFYRSLWSNGLISIKAGPLFDVARVGAPGPGLAPHRWLFDAGAEVKLTVLGTGVVLTYGRDLRTGNNAFYGSVAQH